MVLSDDKEFDAKIIGRDPYTDLALIKIKAKTNLPAVKIGDSDKLEVGEWVVAIGSPFGLERTVTAGIVSAKGRVIGSGPYDNFIQTDASINPGNSGGPLLNMKGEVIGINTMIIAGGQGIGFAIPINLAKGVIEQLKSSGEVTRGWLGVTIQDLKGDLAEYYGIKGGEGALVVDVIPGDPADEAGIKPKDVIAEVNGKKIKSSRDLTYVIAGIGVGKKAKVMVLRNGKEKTFTVAIGKRPDKIASSSDIPKKQGDELGIRVSDITPEIAQRFNIKRNTGVMVIGVELNSKAAEAGFQRGDIIIEINRNSIKDINDYKKMIEKVKKGKQIAFLIERMNAGLIVIQLDK
ncbi:MAG: PDZ domain-containing protein [Desulfobacterales bacterium]|nr:PDZ domain-containing protein [Desulfobacterales bacterium]